MFRMFITWKTAKTRPIWNVSDLERVRFGTRLIRNASDLERGIIGTWQIWNASNLERVQFGSTRVTPPRGLSQ